MPKNPHGEDQEDQNLSRGLTAPTELPVSTQYQTPAT